MISHCLYAGVAGQPEFLSKDCNPRVKSGMISNILCDSHFRRNGTFEFYPDRLNRS